MTTNKIKFSELVIELTETWLMFMHKNAISHNKLLTDNIRRKAAEECELLVDKEYNITEKIDKFFINE